MDISQYEWDVVHQRPGWWIRTLKHLIFMSPVAAAMAFWVYYFATHQSLIKRSELMIFLYVTEVVMIILFNQLLHLVEKALGLRMTHYYISELWLKIQGKEIPMDEFRIAEVSQVIEANSIEYDKWRQPRPADGSLLELTMPIRSGKIKLLFPEEYVKQKFLRTLKNYLNQK